MTINSIIFSDWAIRVKRKGCRLCGNAFSNNPRSTAKYRRIAAQEECHFFDAGSVTGSGVVDGIHLDADQDAILGRRVADIVQSLLSAVPS
jgi:hypothetical protein